MNSFEFKFLLAFLVMAFAAIRIELRLDKVIKLLEGGKSEGKEDHNGGANERDNSKDER